MPIPAPSPSASGGPPCSWDVDPEALGICADWAERPEANRDTALKMATDYLWAATGRQYGVCPVTVRPAQAKSSPMQYQAYPVWPGSDGGYVSGPFLFGGRWYNAGCGACCGSAGCAIVLRGPVATVIEVTVDGEIVPDTAYRVDVTRGAYLLVRTDGGCWPSCQNFTAATTEPDTFAVTYGLGREVPDSLAVAVALLACEYVKAISGDTCALPARMTSLSRQGVEVQIAPADPAQGETGIREVDDIVAILNPGRRQSPPLLLSPDLAESCDRYTVWSA